VAAEKIAESLQLTACSQTTRVLQFGFYLQAVSFFRILPLPGREPVVMLL
jgi:hypothetical protein